MADFDPAVLRQLAESTRTREEEARFTKTRKDAEAIQQLIDKFGPLRVLDAFKLIIILCRAAAEEGKFSYRYSFSKPYAHSGDAAPSEESIQKNRDWSLIVDSKLSKYGDELLHLLRSTGFKCSFEPERIVDLGRCTGTTGVWIDIDW